MISSEKQKKGGAVTHQLNDVSRFASVGWHLDITFEPVPSVYVMLKIHELPPTGGDTLWASGYEIYNRLSPLFADFLEGLTANHDAKFFHDENAGFEHPLGKEIRGSPLNQGDSLTTYPVIRTNRKSCAVNINGRFEPTVMFKDLSISHNCDRLEIRLRQPRFHSSNQRPGGLKDESVVILQYLFNVRIDQWKKLQI